MNETVSEKMVNDCNNEKPSPSTISPLPVTTAAAPTTTKYSKLTAVSPSSSSPIPVKTFTTYSNQVYSVERAIGRGGYGVVYACFDNELNYWALKTSRTSAIILEISVLKEAEDRKCKHFAKIVGDGYSESLKLSFLVMDLLGSSLSDLKSACEGQRFKVGTVLKVAMQTLNAIEELHECGFISRDIKPSNFVASPRISQSSLIYMIDFGISKRYKDSVTNFVYPPKLKCAFRGTARYCSLKNHLREDQGRRDDVESWIYMCSEFANSRLAWTKYARSQRSDIYKAKVAARTQKLNKFIGKLPLIFKEILLNNDALTFESKPYYHVIYFLLDKEHQKLNLCYEDLYDWENLTLYSMTGKSSKSSNSNTPTNFLNSEDDIDVTQEFTDETL